MDKDRIFQIFIKVFLILAIGYTIVYLPMVFSDYKWANSGVFMAMWMGILIMIKSRFNGWEIF